MFKCLEQNIIIILIKKTEREREKERERDRKKLKEVKSMRLIFEEKF